MPKQSSPVFLGVGAAFLLWLLGRNKQQDTGDTTGTITKITLSQFSKGPGDYLGLVVTWVPNTLDRLGKPITWDYRVKGFLYINGIDTGQIIGSNLIDAAAQPSGVTVDSIISAGSTLQASATNFLGPFAVPPRDVIAYGLQYDLQAKVTIEVAKSSIDGTPTAEYLEKAVGVSNTLIINQDWSAKPSVSITGASVT